MMPGTKDFFGLSIGSPSLPLGYAGVEPLNCRMRSWPPIWAPVGRECDDSGGNGLQQRAATTLRPLPISRYRTERRPCTGKNNSVEHLSDDYLNPCASDVSAS